MKKNLVLSATLLAFLGCTKEGIHPESTAPETIVQSKAAKIGAYGGRPITVYLDGTPRGTTPTDPDGTGVFSMTLNPGQEEISYTMTVQNVDLPIFASHIHRAPAGQAGPIVIPLAPPTNGSVSGTVSVSRELILEIIQNPSAFYVNVHNALYPANAISAQLEK